MARNPFKIPGLPNAPSGKLPSDKALNPKSPMARQEEQPSDPEKRQKRFKKLASILARRPQPSPGLQPSPIMPPQTQKLPKF